MIHLKCVENTKVLTKGQVYLCQPLKNVGSAYLRTNYANCDKIVVHGKRKVTVLKAKMRPLHYQTKLKLE